MAGDEHGLVLVPAGCYELQFIDHQIMRIFNVYKLYMNFRIVNAGPHQGKIATRYYGVTMSEAGKTRNRFGFGWYGEGMREYVLLFGERPERNTDISLRKYKASIFLGRIETVITDYKNREKPGLLHNSKVAELIKIVKPLNP